MTIPPREIERADQPELEADASGSIAIETVRPVSKRIDPAWVSDEWVTATVPIFNEATELEAGQEQDIVAAVVSGLDGDHVRIQRVVDALTEALLRGR